MKKSKKQITLNELARMVARGFDETATKRDIADMATKQDIKDMATKQDLQVIHEELSDHGQRLSRIEAKLDRALYKEVARLEDLIRQLARKVKVKLEY
ncbi:MAG: hypothetical protein ABIH38_01210 [Patescibacteria group bacterium]